MCCASAAMGKKETTMALNPVQTLSSICSRPLRTYHAGITKKTLVSLLRFEVSRASWLRKLGT